MGGNEEQESVRPNWIKEKNVGSFISLAITESLALKNHLNKVQVHQGHLTQGHLSKVQVRQLQVHQGYLRKLQLHPLHRLPLLNQ